MIFHPQNANGVAINLKQIDHTKYVMGWIVGVLINTYHRVNNKIKCKTKLACFYHDNTPLTGHFLLLLFLLITFEQAEGLL